MSQGGSPGVLQNVTDPARRAAFLLGLNASQRQLGARIAARGGVLMANGLHKEGDNGMLFEEWCGEHSYLRRRNGCGGFASPIACDMMVLQNFSKDPRHVALVHMPDAPSPEGHLTGRGLVKLAAFLWAAGPSAFFADVPPLKSEKAHWQCDEWAAMPATTEVFSKPLGQPAGLGVVSDGGLFTRSFVGGAHVQLDLRDDSSQVCIRWRDGSTSGEC